MKKRRKKQRPIVNESGELVTPVTGEPAAKINWAIPCPVCKTRTCAECNGETLHFATTCKHCGSGKLGELHRGTDTKANGTIESKVGTRQKLKCRSCGHNWTRIVKAPAG